MKSVTYRAPAKVILSGEHAVVYGKPALVCGLGKYCTVTVSTGLQKERATYIEEIYMVVKNYLKKTNAHFQEQPLTITFKNDIPLGRGLGSSASLCVALVAASLHFYTDTPPSKEIINTLAYQAEKHFHGNPSGADNTTCCYGGLIFYRKEFEFLKTISALNCKLPQSIEKQLFLIDTGKPEETTAEMVSHVGQLYNKQPKKTDSTLYAIEKVTKRLVVSIIKEDTQMFRDCLTDNQKLLVQLHVVSEQTQKLVKELQTFGAGKITGAGGQKDGSGYLLFFADSPEALTEYLTAHDIPYLSFSQDYQGVQML